MDLLGNVAIGMMGIGFVGLLLNLVTPRKRGGSQKVASKQLSVNSQQVSVSSQQVSVNSGYVMTSSDREMYEKIAWLSVVPGSDEWKKGKRESNLDWKDPNEPEAADVRAARIRLGLPRL